DYQSRQFAGHHLRCGINGPGPGQGRRSGQCHCRAGERSDRAHAAPARAVERRNQLGHQEDSQGLSQDVAQTCVSATPDDCAHLSVDTVREIHAEAIKRFGGLNGVRDENLLASAVLTPQSSFGGKSPYADIVEVAAAYLFYICNNHPFLDGNKRTAMMAAIVFLRLNGIEPLPDSGKWEKLMLDVAANKLDRATTTQRLRKLLKRQRKPRHG